MLICCFLSFLLAVITEYKIMLKIVRRNNPRRGDDLPSIIAIVFGVLSAIGTYQLSLYVPYGAIIATVLTIPAVTAVMLAITHGLRLVRRLIGSSVDHF